MKLLLFGKDGQVGQALQPVLAPLGDVVALGRSGADFSRPETLGSIIAQQAPDVIVNAAAYTAVDAAEDNRDAAWTINAASVGAIGEAAHRIGALVVHYSTDYVFDGLGSGYLAETDPTSPLSVYGASKLAGEVLLRDSRADYLTLRTSWVYAPSGRNFPLNILRLARERETLTVVADQIGAPTPVELIAGVTVQVIQKTFGDRSKVGLYHLVAGGETSWHGFAQLLIAEAEAAGAQLRLASGAIAPIAAVDYPTRAKRPSNSRLDTGKLRSVFDIALPSWQDGVRRLITTLQAEGRL